MTPLLDVAELRSGYKQMEVLHGVSLHVMPGEIVALVGANGAGKSTLLNTITGVVPARAGRIGFDKTLISALPTRDIVRMGIGVVPERRQLFGTMSVEENLLDRGLCALRSADPEAAAGRDGARVRAVPEVARAAAPARPVDERRRAADDCDRARPDGEAAAVVARRTVARTCPAGCRSDRRADRPAARRRLHDPAGRTECAAGVVDLGSRLHRGDRPHRRCREAPPSCSPTTAFRPPISAAATIRPIPWKSASGRGVPAETTDGVYRLSRSASQCFSTSAQHRHRVAVIVEDHLDRVCRLAAVVGDEIDPSSGRRRGRSRTVSRCRSRQILLHHPQLIAQAVWPVQMMDRAHVDVGIVRLQVLERGEPGLLGRFKRRDMQEFDRVTPRCGNRRIRQNDGAGERRRRAGRPAVQRAEAGVMAEMHAFGIAEQIPRNRSAHERAFLFCGCRRHARRGRCRRGGFRRRDPTGSRDRRWE